MKNLYKQLLLFCLFGFFEFAYAVAQPKFIFSEEKVPYNKLFRGQEIKSRAIRQLCSGVQKRTNY